MSLIPKTSVGIDSRKYRRNQSCMVHGTSEIGFVFPTYARNYINDATINLGTRTGVRLSPLFVPTMGKLDVRHYHCFVPWNRVYSPFDAFLAREPFNFASNSRIPDVLPSFSVGQLLAQLMFYDSTPRNWYERGELYTEDGCSVIDWIESGMFNVGLTASVYRAPYSNGRITGPFEQVNWSNTNTETQTAVINACFSTGARDNLPTILSSGTPVYGLMPSMIRTSVGEYFMECKKENGIISCLGLAEISDGSNYNSHVVSEYLASLSYPSIDACDFSYEVTAPSVSPDYSYLVCFNFNGMCKRLRSIFMGLGYSFNPFDEELDTPLKLFAFYRAWYSLFGVTRDTNFNDTECAWIYRFFSSYYIGTSPILSGTQAQLDSHFLSFIHDLCDLTYTTPADYFTSAVQNVNQGVDNREVILDGETEVTFSRAVANGRVTPSARGVVDGSGAIYVPAVAMQLANRLLRWVNKNTVVGRKISDILYSRYGKIETDDDSSEGVYRVGVDTTNIEIGIIFNQTSGEGSAPLGEFSGVGSGGSRAPKHTFVTPSYGCFITLTAVVPEMGYFQGKLRENSDGIRDSFEFPDTAFDAVGWQTVRYHELVADRQFKRTEQPLSGSTTLGVYGRQPRYTDKKVGFNRVLGDISLPHMQQNMLSYTLDRYFNPRDEFLPINNPVTSRRGDIGDTNRIFEVVSPTDDHIIYQIYFDISVNDRLKPLALSYDTILEGDDKSVDFGHQ